MATKLIPDEVPGTITVSEKAFFATVGKLNVHPSIPGSHDSTFGYRSEWKMQDGSQEIVGYSFSKNHLSKGRWMVTKRF